MGKPKPPAPVGMPGEPRSSPEGTAKESAPVGIWEEPAPKSSGEPTVRQPAEGADDFGRGKEDLTDTGDDFGSEVNAMMSELLAVLNNDIEPEPPAPMGLPKEPSAPMGISEEIIPRYQNNKEHVEPSNSANKSAGTEVMAEPNVIKPEPSAPMGIAEELSTFPKGVAKEAAPMGISEKPAPKSSEGKPMVAQQEENGGAGGTEELPDTDDDFGSQVDDMMSELRSVLNDETTPAKVEDYETQRRNMVRDVNKFWGWL